MLVIAFVVRAIYVSIHIRDISLTTLIVLPACAHAALQPLTNHLGNHLKNIEWSNALRRAKIHVVPMPDCPLAQESRKSILHTVKSLRVCFRGSHTLHRNDAKAERLGRICMPYHSHIDNIGGDLVDMWIRTCRVIVRNLAMPRMTETRDSLNSTVSTISKHVLRCRSFIDQSDVNDEFDTWRLYHTRSEVRYGWHEQGLFAGSIRCNAWIWCYFRQTSKVRPFNSKD